MTPFKFIFRKLWRDRFFTFLKAMGLGIGVATCLVIFKIVHYEYSFDRNHPGKQQIYQVVINYIEGDRTSGFGGMQSAVADYLGDHFPEIEQVVPLYTQDFPFVSVEKEGQEVFRKEDPKKIQSTNSTYFKMVPYRWLAGTTEEVLSQPNQVVLTASRAETYFGKLPYQEMIGKTILYDGTPYIVEGVVADLDTPSSFEGKEFVSIDKKIRDEADWFSFNSNYTLFVKLEPNQKERLLKLLDTKYDAVIPEEWKSGRGERKYGLLPLSEKHFSAEYAAAAYTANKKMVLGLVGIGLFILLLAGINYINLSTAQLPYRAKEIGVRKTLGEKGGRLTLGFLYETLIICILAGLFAIPLSRGFEYFYGDFMPPQIGEYSAILPISLFVVLLVMVLTVLTGLYPAYLVNRINVSETLKIQGVGKFSLGSLRFRKALITFQFVIAQVFVIGAFIIASQIRFMLNSDLGFDKEAVITFELPYKSYQNADTDPFLLKQALQNYPEIQGVALGHTPMNNMMWGNTLFRQTDGGEQELNMNFKYVDVDYVDLFGLAIKAGRAPELRDTVGSVFLNETARSELGFKTNEEAIGQTLKEFSGKSVAVQGIVNDFYQSELHVEKAPLTLKVTADKEMLMSFSVKLSPAPSEWDKGLTALEKEWKTYYPDAPFDYEFYDSEIKQLYESDLRQSKMINLATVITIILGCLGLIGLVTLTAYQRTKEIGIRKVLGSSVSEVVVLLSKDYLKLIGWAILISIPIAWWAGHKWLDNFAYRIEIKWWMFLLTGLVTLLIALLAVSARAIKAALANPVESLKDE